MDQLKLCRMCLADDVPMRLLENKYLQAMYEKMTEMPFVREDRAVLACYICYARLVSCYKFRKNWLRSEQLIQQINTNVLSPVKLNQLVRERMFCIKEVTKISCQGVDSDNTTEPNEGQLGQGSDAEGSSTRPCSHHEEVPVSGALTTGSLVPASDVGLSVRFYNKKLPSEVMNLPPHKFKITVKNHLMQRDLTKECATMSARATDGRKPQEIPTITISESNEEEVEEEQNRTEMINNEDYTMDEDEIKEVIIEVPLVIPNGEEVLPVFKTECASLIDPSGEIITRKLTAKKLV